MTYHHYNWIFVRNFKARKSLLSIAYIFKNEPCATLHWVSFLLFVAVLFSQLFGRFNVRFHSNLYIRLWVLLKITFRFEWRKQFVSSAVGRKSYYPSNYSEWERLPCTRSSQALLVGVVAAQAKCDPGSVTHKRLVALGYSQPTVAERKRHYGQCFFGD